MVKKLGLKNYKRRWKCHLKQTAAVENLLSILLRLFFVNYFIPKAPARMRFKLEQYLIRLPPQSSPTPRG